MKKITRPLTKKKCNFSKILLILLSSSVKRVGVSRMRDFFFNTSLPKLWPCCYIPGHVTSAVLANILVAAPLTPSTSTQPQFAYCL